jgi:hypothetical protein
MKDGNITASAPPIAVARHRHRLDPQRRHSFEEQRCAVLRIDSIFDDASGDEHRRGRF